MTSEIILQNVGLDFIAYNKKLTIKEFFIDFLSKKNRQTQEIFSALININLHIIQGDRLGIIGFNGAGKSSLLKILSKIYPPTTGTIKVNGKIAPLLEIGAGFNNELSGRENIYLNGTILGYTKRQIKNIENEIIEFSELTQFIDMPIKHYSTGMYMKLAFSIATSIKPDILILDELFAGGDLNFIKKAQTRIKTMIENANIIVFVSHQMELLLELCNRVIWIEHGCIVADGNPKQIIERYLNQ